MTAYFIAENENDNYDHLRIMIGRSKNNKAAYIGVSNRKPVRIEVDGLARDR